MAGYNSYKRLVKLVARAFYDEEIPSKGTNRSKSDKSDNRGIAVVILDALTRREWVKEEDLAKRLGLHPKQLRRTLRVLEQEWLVVREHRRENVKAAKVFNAAVAAVSENGGEPQQEEKLKVHTHSYCCLDYAQVYDVVRYRIHRAKKKIKDELEDRNTLQEYICPSAGCGRRYTALDVSRLITPFDDNFHCENCDCELVAESDKLAAEDVRTGEGEDNARRRRRETLKELYGKLEVNFKPLLDQIAKLKDVAPPEFKTLAEWESRAVAHGRAAMDEDGVLRKPSHGQGISGTPIHMGETTVVVDLDGKDKGAKEEAAAAAQKVLPPWMIRQGMSLTSEQRGDGPKQEEGAEVPTSQVGEPVDDKEAVQRKIQEEYIKAYYAALLQRQQASEQVTAEPAQVVDPSTPVPDEPSVDLNEVPSGTPPAAVQQTTDMEEDEDDDIDWE